MRMTTETKTPAALRELYAVPESEREIGSPTLPKTMLEGALIALAAAIVYAIVGYLTVVDAHIVQFNALERLADAYLAWWNDPPKLAAIGLEIPPVGTLVFLPLALIKPLATSLVALPLVTAVAGGAALAMLNTLLARCEIGRGVRYALVALLAVNPLFVFYAANGSPEALGFFLAAAALLALVSWGLMDETRYLVGAGMAMGAAVLTDYTYLAWALAIMLAIAFVGPGARGGQAKLRSSLLLFLTPVAYSILVWSVLNAVILDDPFRWVEIGSTQAITNLDPAVTEIPASFGTALGDLAEAVLGAAPLAFLALPLLLISAVARRDAVGYGLVFVLLLAAGAVVGEALLEDRADVVSLAAVLPLTAAALAAAAWLHRTEEGGRPVIALAMLVIAAAALPLAWNAMRSYAYQDQEQAFTRFLETGDSQEGTESRGGYRVGIDPELAMADYIKSQLRPAKNSILTDSSFTYGVILLSGRPDLFVDRADLEEGEWLALRDRPFGEVDYMLVADDGRNDLISSNYPGIELGAVPGLVPIFHTDRYVLLQVDRGARAEESQRPRPRQLPSQPRLVVPTSPLEPPPVQPSGSLDEAGLSPLPEEPGAAVREGSLNSAPTVSGE